MLRKVSRRQISSVTVIESELAANVGEVLSVDHVPGRTEMAEVAACTATAAHGRDHDHPSGACCHPHAVQVIYLGPRALTVCHDCRTDSGFLPCREAERVATAHRDQTRGASVSLGLADAS
jgi:hypothetical protein